MMKKAPNSVSDRVQLRDVTDADLSHFFEHQLDTEANHMAAFTTEDPTDHDAFLAHWTKIRGDQATVIKTILFDGDVAGHIASFRRFGDLEVTYWIGKESWGKGIASSALAQFLAIQKERPIHARAARDNVASLRVLEKCGFTITGEDKGFANARGEETEELILRLDLDQS
ncbi:MAG: GNAT family N-acetyltransferase [bacterium]